MMRSICMFKDSPSWPGSTLSLRKPLRWRFLCQITSDSCTIAITAAGLNFPEGHAKRIAFAMLNAENWQYWISSGATWIDSFGVLNPWTLDTAYLRASTWNTSIKPSSQHVIAVTWRVAKVPKEVPRYAHTLTPCHKLVLIMAVNNNEWRSCNAVL